MGSLFEATDAQDLSDPAAAACNGLHFKMAFDGCGVTAGMMGLLFAYGLQPQVEAVAARVMELCAAHDVQPLHINVLGLSRGGIAAYMLARHVSGLGCASRLRLSLCVFDPVRRGLIGAACTMHAPWVCYALHAQVPGNLINTAKYLDLTGTVTTANRHIDLRSCRIVRCLALYPADPLPDLAFHAPLLPDYPEGCEVEEDATLGCHQARALGTALCKG